MSTNTLVSRKAHSLDVFRRHIDVATWNVAAWESYEAHAEIARAHGPIGGFTDKARRRTAVVVLLAYGFALYAAIELLEALGFLAVDGLDERLADLVTGPLAKAEARLGREGDLLFRLKAERRSRSVITWFDRFAGRLPRLTRG
ncbi:hypothetical protein [Streptomyces chartreusis]|uniref:hypothetical protein n=1 Tax=Streptomyces chartreusis TaxID=1969 RepID=UPI0036915206